MALALKAEAAVPAEGGGPVVTDLVEEKGSLAAQGLEGSVMDTKADLAPVPIQAQKAVPVGQDFGTLLRDVQLLLELPDESEILVQLLGSLDAEA